MVSLNTAAINSRFSSFWAEAKGLPTRDLGGLLKKHGLEHAPIKSLSRMANLVGMPRDARVALLSQHQLNLKSLASSTKAISMQGLATGKAFENRQMGRVGSFFAQKFPTASGFAMSAVDKLSTLPAKAGAVVGETVKKGGFFGKLLGKVTSVVGKLSPVLGKIGGVFAKIGNVARMIPGLNLIFVGVDLVKFVKNPSMANLAKLGLSVGAALPIPGASLLGGVRVAADVVPMAMNFGSRMLGSGQPQPA